MPPARVSGGPCSAQGLFEPPVGQPPTVISNGHILEVVNRCTRHQKALTRCSARWREWQREQWDCGACEWNVYVCAASVVCMGEARDLLLKCSAPATSAAAAVGEPGCQDRWLAMRQCLGRQGLHLRWNGERDCRTSSSIYV
mmetsp:Transcript_135401/g.377164  ORF Transcript_135401/g.377164 Transcript_135401/m.377164 type:complete len:142 (-) Transcript_135401:224-649(-)